MPVPRLLFGTFVAAAQGGAAISLTFFKFLIVAFCHALIEPMLHPVAAILASLGPAQLLMLVMFAVHYAEDRRIA